MNNKFRMVFVIWKEGEQYDREEYFGNFNW